MIEKRLSEVTPLDIHQLINNCVAEGKTIEFKSHLPNESEKEKIPFLAGISALANTIGGDFILGIIEEKGVAKDYSYIEIEDIDKEKQRLENMIREGIEPRIFNVDIRPIEIQKRQICYYYQNSSKLECSAQSFI